MISMKKFMFDVVIMLVATTTIGLVVSNGAARWKWAKACDARSAATGELICTLPIPPLAWY